MRGIVLELNRIASDIQSFRKTAIIDRLDLPSESVSEVRKNLKKFTGKEFTREEVLAALNDLFIRVTEQIAFGKPIELPSIIDFYTSLGAPEIRKEEKKEE